MHRLRAHFLDSASRPAPSSPPPSATAPQPPPPPTPLDIVRYRYHHGVNLGSIFVLEKWLFPSMFLPTAAQGESELDAVAASVQAHGIAATRNRWEAHWTSSALPSDSTISWLGTVAGITTVRLPIGYFTLGGGGGGGGGTFCKDTPFAPYAAVYANAWDAVLALCERLARVGGMGVLLDLHALPGGANDQAHGGTGSGRAELWGDRRYLERAEDCAVWVAGEVARGKVKACVGVQIVNEACWGAGEMGMWEWAGRVVDRIEKLEWAGAGAGGGSGNGLPIYVSDAWNTGEALEWCLRRNRVSGGGKCPVGVAVSKYFCFSDEDKGKGPWEIFAQVADRELGEVQDRGGGNVLNNGARQVFVTEWSCALDPASKAKVPQEERKGLVKRFGEVQGQRWRKKAGGSWFWTAKMDWMDGGEWGMFEMVKTGAVVPASNLRMDLDEVRSRIKVARVVREESRSRDVDGHVAYWAQHAPKTNFEHWRFEQGWNVGFDDALAFFEARSSGAKFSTERGGDTIGALELWILKRLRDGGAERWGEFGWEWEHGFRQGLAAFETRAFEGL